MEQLVSILMLSVHYLLISTTEQCSFFKQSLNKLAIINLNVYQILN